MHRTARLHLQCLRRTWTYTQNTGRCTIVVQRKYLEKTAKNMAGLFSSHNLAMLDNNVKDRMFENTSSQTPERGSVECTITGNDESKGDGTKKTDNKKILKTCSPSIKKILDETCQKIFEMHRPSEEDLLRRQEWCNELEIYLKNQCHKDVELQLFGSSVNGFTFHESDLDLCLTFRGCHTDETVSRQVLIAVMDVLKSHKNFYNVLILYHAQVPIVKFCVRNEKFQAGDISLYNRLAVANTSLLSTYAAIDDRVKILGYMFKHFMKSCKSERLRTRTSYAYMMLVIYFLQQCDPPVLPVLQEMHEGKKRPQVMIDGWNAWFYNDVKKIPEVWNKCGQNKASVGELWFEMLNFYAKLFDFDSTVVSIRQKKPMKKEAKIKNINYLSQRRDPLWKRKVHGGFWVKNPILIEDPFDLGHNLIAPLRRSTYGEFLGLLHNAIKQLHDVADGENNGKYQTNP